MRAREEVSDTTSYTYYPGCSLHATGIGYDKSMRAVFRKLGLELDELDDWNCCGATAYMSVKETVAFAISARNLALAEASGRDLVAPCSACYAVLNKTRKFLNEVPQLRSNVSEALAEGHLECKLDVPVRHPLEVLINDIGIDRIAAAQSHSIADFRPACYYGCQIVRPQSSLAGDPEVPMAMEELFTALGAAPVEYPPKVRCCGGMLVATAEDVALRLADEILGWAMSRKANCIVTVCPLCQGNLDILGRRGEIANNGSPSIPILYFTQLLGLALGCTPSEVGLQHCLIPVTLGQHRSNHHSNQRAKWRCEMEDRTMTRKGEASVESTNGAPRIGVYVCHCGVNISTTVDVAAVREAVANKPHVVSARDYKFMCSNGGQDLIKKDIREQGVNRVVVAACSPLMHELTFRSAASDAGLNPYLVQIANIREQCAWVHSDSALATDKATALTSGAAARVALHQPLQPMQAEINPGTLVVGAGIAGIQAALEIADAGHDVYLVEKGSTIGGQMAKFDKTFPTLDCAACILTPKMASVGHRQNLHLMTLSEVQSVDGFVGNFKVSVRQRARYVNDLCTSCGECSEVCPVSVPSPFDEMCSDRTAIHRAFPQAVPTQFVIEKQGRPPCREACPVHQDAAGYVALVAAGRFAEAARLIRRQNPLPSICGRVCYAACEEACSRANVDQPIAIRDLKRFVMDWERRHVGDIEPPAIENEYAERVAVIGSGPAGLTCAFDLARKGYRVTVFEKHRRLGGMLAVGLPGYRCPRPEVERDLDVIRKMGVEFRPGRELGVDFTMDDLVSDDPETGFQAIFLGIGAHRGLEMGIEGEDAEGVVTGVDYLRHLNLGRPQWTGKRVAIVGGGNTAMDAARAARREGAEVTVIYRRTRSEMPAEEDEYEDAVAEGVAFEYLLQPITVVQEEGKVAGLECVRMELGIADDSGRPRPIVIPGSEHVRPFDQVIPAISQRPIWRWLGSWRAQAEADPSGHLSFTPWETLKVDPESMRSGHPRIFGGGDVVLGPSTIIESMGQGRRAAEAIDKQLRCLPLADFTTYIPPEDPRRGFEQRPHAYSQNYEEMPAEARIPMPKRAPDIRITDYEPVDLGYTEEQAQQEAARCLHCGVCVECYECERVCEPGAVVHDMIDTTREIEVGQILVATGYQQFDARKMTQYGYGRYENVVSALEFERMLSSTGPTGGQILCANGSPPRAVGIVHCVGSRDEKHHRYCSRVCCMYALKFAHLVRDRTTADVYQFYIDLRAFGKGYEEFYSHVLDEGATVIRGKVAEVVPVRGGNGHDGGHLVIRCEDTLLSRFREIPVDMVVLCNALEAHADAAQVGRTFSLSRSPDGFFLERHPKLDPVGTTTDGVFVAGCCQGPKDIPDTVAQGQAAAARILAQIAKGTAVIDPVRATIDARYCSGCKTCLDLCPYAAISFTDELGVATINDALCKGCGTCVAACPASAITGAGFTDGQILAELEGVLTARKENEVRDVYSRTH